MRSRVRGLVAVVLFVAAGVAQSPPAAPPLDLPAIAKLLEGNGELPDALAPMVRSERDEAVEFGKRLTAAELDATFDEGIDDARLAIAVIAGGDAARGTRIGLAREACACFALARAGRKLGVAQRLEFSSSTSRWQDVRSRAQRRGGVLTARFLRTYPEAPEVGHLLLAVPDSLLPGNGPSVREAALRLLAGEATVREHLECIGDLFAAGRTSAVEPAIAAAERARPARLPWQRELDAASLAGARRRLAAAREHEASAREPGLAGRIAKLRYLQRTDERAAVAEAEAMLAEGVEHALPATVLAADAMTAGRTERAAELVERARALPGADAQLGVLNLLVRVRPASPSERASPALQQRDDAAFLEVCDAMVAGDESEPARLWRGMRALGFVPGGDARILQDTAALTKLATAVPDSVAAMMLLVAAAANADAAAGFAALAELPKLQASWPDMRRLHATALVRLALLADDEAHTKAVEDALLALERGAGDPREARYLRGVLAWSRAARSGSADDRMRAREHFTAAQRMAFEPGAWPAAWGSFLAATSTDAATDPRELERVRDVALDRGEEPRVVPASALWLGRDPTPGLVASAERLLEAESMTGTAKRVLWSALAAAHAQRDDRNAARAAARQALALRIPAYQETLLARGVLALGHFRWNWAVRVAGVELEVRLQLELLPLPPLPDRVRLEELARE